MYKSSAIKATIRFQKWACLQVFRQSVPLPYRQVPTEGEHRPVKLESKGGQQQSLSIEGRTSFTAKTQKRSPL